MEFAHSIKYEIIKFSNLNSHQKIDLQKINLYNEVIRK